ncbi:MAG: pseudouridine synthase [Wenzhouxiangellaceae bacterium]
MTDTATSGTLDLLYLDDRLCAIAKPCGIMVHRTGISTDRVFLVDLLRERLGRRIWTVHRLDRATSGVLLFALDVEMAAELGRLFEAGAIAKRYLAVVRGWLDESGAIDKPLRGARNKTRNALTRYRRIATTELPVAVPPHETARYSLAVVEPKTGRTHQIRRHFNHISHPIVGDVNHGDRRHNRLFRIRFGCHRLLLHAVSLEFEHPATGRPLNVHAAPSDDFLEVVGALGWSDTIARISAGISAGIWAGISADQRDSD